jgi:acyl carrier protein
MEAAQVTPQDQARLHEGIAQYAGIEPEQLRDEHRLFDHLRFDSLDRIELSMKLEDDFGIEIDDAEMAEVETVADVKALVAKKLEKTAA